MASRLGTQVSSTISFRSNKNQDNSRLGNDDVINFNPENRRKQNDGSFQGFTIRGISNTQEEPMTFAIKGESGPTTVLITGLDKGSNSDDVMVTALILLFCEKYVC